MLLSQYIIFYEKRSTDAIASIPTGTTIKSFDTKTYTAFSQVPIGFAPISGNLQGYGRFLVITMNSTGHYVVAVGYGNGLVSDTYDIRVFYIE